MLKPLIKATRTKESSAPEFALEQPELSPRSLVWFKGLRYQRDVLVEGVKAHFGLEVDSDAMHALRTLADIHLEEDVPRPASVSVLAEKLVSFLLDDSQLRHHSVPSAMQQASPEPLDSPDIPGTVDELDLSSTHKELDAPREIGLISSSIQQIAKEKAVGRHVALAMSKGLGKKRKAPIRQ